MRFESKVSLHRARLFGLAAGLLVAAVCLASASWAQEAAPPTPEQLKELLGTPKVIMDTVWTMITGMLVFFMNLGFAMVESGLCRAKNAVNILAKNFVVFGVSSLAFLILGWGLMFGDGNSFVGTSGLFFVGGADNSPASGDAYSGVYTAIAWATVPLWWLGQNCWNIARYVRDAQTEALPLVGGGEHDWAFLLDHWGVLERDQAIGRTVYLAGMVCYLAAVVGGWLALRAQEPMRISSAKETS